MTRSCGAVSAAVLVLAALVVPTEAATGPNGMIAYAAWDAEQTGHDVWLIDPAVPDTAPVRLTTDGRYNNNPDWNAAGTRIVYDGYGRFGSSRIWAMDADPSSDDWAPLSAPACTPGGCFSDFLPAWSPNGQKIAFTSNRSPAGWGMGGYEIFVMDASGETAEKPALQLTDTRTGDNWAPTDWYASWSPDSARLVFASSRGEGRFYDSCDLYVMDAVDGDGDGNGDNVRRITFDGTGGSFTIDCELLQPAWSPVPGSSLVTFASTRAGSHFDIWIVDVDNPTDLRNVTESSEEVDDTPSWSPDGTQIIYRSSRSGSYELWSLPVPSAVASGPDALSMKSAGDGTTTAGSAIPTRLTANGGTENSPRDEQAADWGQRSGSSGVELAVRKRGTGGGRIRSSPDGIRCGTDCTEIYRVGTAVTLTATAGRNSRFAGWRGGCAHATTASCTVTMDAAKTVAARFIRTAVLTVEKAGSGRGRVTSSPAGITCGTDCWHIYDAGSQVVLTAVAASGSKFTGWIGPCSGTGACLVNVDRATTVTATFDSASVASSS